jgi:outer membrane protein OmpA-like peptidoglycan-associated protein
MSMSDDDQLGLVLGIVFAVVAALIGLLIGMAAIHRVDRVAEPLPQVSLSTPAAPVPAPAASGPDPQAVADAASITVEYGVVKLYFASGKTALAAGAAAALSDVVTGARGGKKVVISGFHDSRGNAAANADMARRRAMAVRDALLAAGVPASQITLEKPAQSAGTGSDEEARRVEISLQ